MQVADPFFGIIYSISNNATAHTIFQEKFNQFIAIGANIYSIAFAWNQIDNGSVNASIYLDILKAAQLVIIILKIIHYYHQ